MPAKIVIGIGFGDEGKGITTDYLCQRSSDPSKIVVRFSGGQQAGHNVVIAGMNHIHSNYGSGTLRGVPSYFSEHCTIYPLTMWREREVLIKKGVRPKVTIHPMAMVTTPFDVVYNRMTELKLGHGSCGLGISATMKRNQTTGYKLYAIDLVNTELLSAKLKQILEYYKALFLDHEERVQFMDDAFVEFELFMGAVKALYFDIRSYEYLRKFNEIIFEGSQGVLLDMDHGVFPNVTHANTTSKNALEICRTLHISNMLIEMFYVTRCYQTRHGAGWMSNIGHVELIHNEHEINKFNEWQKNFKVAELDYSLLDYALNVDNIYSEGITKNLVVTCLDQRPGFRFDKSQLSNTFDKIIISDSPESINITDIQTLVSLMVDE